MASAAFQVEMARLQDAHPKTKVEFISTLGVVTDISAYYDSGAEFTQIKQRAPNEIQAGNFDIVLINNDDKFSELVATSLFYNAQYHGAAIRISEGFVLPDGTEEYVVQMVGYIDTLQAAPDLSTVTLSCRDRVRSILDQSLHPSSVSEVPFATTGNVGTGVINTIATLPFKTKNELWTITCTLAGGDGVATFSVVGATSGNVGTATSGTQFTTGSGAGGIKFTISAGSTAFIVGDSFTFTTKQYPEWDGVNAGKIIWSILTGYDWDTNTLQPWSGLVFSFDHTQSTANTDLNYTAFATAITTLDTLNTYALSGYIGYDIKAVDFLQSLVLQFLGAIYTGSDGRLTLQVYAPTFTSATPVSFSDANKITLLGYTRTVDEIINRVTVSYKATKTWQFSDVDPIYDGFYVAENSTSEASYVTVYGEDFQLIWYSTGGQHAVGFAQRIVNKYSDPPFNVDFVTGLDALLTGIGDTVTITDTKYGMSGFTGEVAKIIKQFDQNPAQIQLRVRRDADLSQVFGYIGSTANEGDGISPQSDNYDTATTSDKLFAYFSQTGGAVPPDYRMF